MAVEEYNLKELKELIKNGENFRLFKPFYFKGQILLNIEKILTEKDLDKLDGKVFGPIQVVRAVEHNADEKLRKALVASVLNVLKSSKLFKLSESNHLDYNKRKECEKLFDGIINGNPHLAHCLYKIYKHSKKLFLHSVHVGIIATVIDLGIQEKYKKHDGLRSEEIVTGALLHDIGLITFSQDLVEKRRIEILQTNPALYRTYPEKGREILKKLNDSIRRRSIEIVYQHQERLDGSGFPQGLRGNNIEELALIVGLADEFDLLVNNEITNTQKPIPEIMSRLARMKNYFGSDAVDSFYTWFRYLK